LHHRAPTLVLGTHLRVLSCLLRTGNCYPILLTGITETLGDVGGLVD
jgi:hypothetical protein